MRTLSTHTNSSQNGNNVSSRGPKVGNLQCYIYKKTVRKGKKSEEIFLLQNFGDMLPGKAESLKGRVTKCSRLRKIIIAITILSVCCYFFSFINNDY